jgi:hypothetical protein
LEKSRDGSGYELDNVIPAGAIYFSLPKDVQAASEARQASYSMGNGFSPGVEANRA